MKRSRGGVNDAFASQKTGFSGSKWSKVGYKSRGLKAIYKNSVYIHYMQQHFHSSGGGSEDMIFRSSNILESMFNNAKADAISLYSNAMQKKMNQKDLDSLSAYLNTSLINGDFLDSLDEAMAEQFQNIIKDRSKAFEYYQNNFGKVSEIAQNVFKDIVEQGDSSIKNLSLFIKKINHLTHLMERGSNKIVFWAILNKAYRTALHSPQSKTTASFLKKIETQLKSQATSQIIKETQYAESLQYYLNVLQELKLLASEKDYYKIARGFSKKFKQNYISKGLAEVTTWKADQLADTTILKNIPTGKNITTNVKYDSQKNIFKSDNTYKDQQVTLRLKENEFNIQMQLQLSIKFYQSAAFNRNSSGISTMDISSGSGGTLEEFFDAIKLAEENKYQIYNALTFVGISEQFKNLILRRQFFRLFSTNGYQDSSFQDFSGYILVNGELVSIWRLFNFIQKKLDTNEKIDDYINLVFERSDSNRKSANGSSRLVGPKTLHIDDNWMFLNQWQNSGGGRGHAALIRKNLGAAWKRAEIINNDINATTIHATLHLHKVIQAFSSASLMI